MMDAPSSAPSQSAASVENMSSSNSRRCWTAPQTATCILLLNNNSTNRRAATTVEDTTQQLRPTDVETTTASSAPPSSTTKSSWSSLSTSSSSSLSSFTITEHRQQQSSTPQHHHHHQQQHHHKQHHNDDDGKNDVAVAEDSHHSHSRTTNNSYHHRDLLLRMRTDRGAATPPHEPSAAAAAAAATTATPGTSPGSAVTASATRRLVGSASSSSSSASPPSSSSSSSTAVAAATAATITTTIGDPARSVNGAPSSIADHLQQQQQQRTNKTLPPLLSLHKRQQHQQQHTAPTHQTRASSPSQAHVVTIQISQPPPPQQQQTTQTQTPLNSATSDVRRGPVTVVCFTPSATPAAEMVVQTVTTATKPMATSANVDAAAASQTPDNSGSSPPSSNGSSAGNKSTYLYYMMASGQCSPSASSDTMDSGTCSDLETTPPPLPKKYGSGKGGPGGASVQSGGVGQKVSDNGAEKQPQLNNTNNSSSAFSDDSEEGSESSLSFDSLNTGSLRRPAVVTGGIPIPPAMPAQSDDDDEADDEVSDVLGHHQRHQQRRRAVATAVAAALPDSLLRDIRDRTQKHSSSGDEEEEEELAAGTNTTITTTTSTTASAPAAATTIHTQHTSAMLASLRPTGQPPHKRIDIFASHMDTLTDPTSYENDRFYTFHINERPAGDGGGASSNGDAETDAESGASLLSSLSEDDGCFAGIRELHRLSGGGSGSGGNGCGGASTIRSAKGTVRGVKNRVRNGIATFLQMQQTNVKNYKEKDAGKVVLYTTSMGIVRQTYAKCANVKQILRTLLVKFEERDVFMSIDYQQEVRDRMQSDDILIPQLYVDGHHVGDADQVERLNESGELRQMLKPYKSTATIFTCQACGGYRLLPCPSCKGSKKSVHRNHFTTEFVALKCMNCDEVGLVKCYNC